MLKIFYFSALELGKPDAAYEHTFEIAIQLAKRGHQLTLFIPASDDALPKLPQTMKVVQIPVLGKKVSIPFTLTFYLLLPWFALNHFRQTRPDIVYTRFSFLEFLSLFPLKSLFSFIYIAEVNGVRSLESRGGSWQRRFIYWCEKHSLRMCDQAIGVTPEQCQWIVQVSGLPHNLVKCVGNGVNTELFSPIPIPQAISSLKLDPQIIYINYTSTFKPWHGSRVIIQALPEIVARSSNSIHLLMIGDGPERPLLMKLATELNVNQDVQWVGSMPRNQVPMYINASTVCLMPIAPGERTKIGFSPLKIFEYMSCGKPIVTNCINSSYDEMIVSGPYGILVEPGNPTALANAVIDLLAHPEIAEEIGRRNRQVVLEKYSWDHITDQVEKVLLDSQKKEVRQ